MTEQNQSQDQQESAPAERPGRALQPYEVGYGKPPKKSQFQKGQTGNPKGRKKNSKNLATWAQEIFFEPVTVTIRGRRRTIPKVALAMLINLNKACAGDHHAFTKVVEVASKLGKFTVKEEVIAGVLRVPWPRPETSEEFEEMCKKELEAMSIPGDPDLERLAENAKAAREAERLLRNKREADEAERIAQKQRERRKLAD